VALDVHRFERAANDPAGLGWRALMIVFGPFLHGSLLDGCRQILRAKRSQFLQADWFSRCGGTCRTTREIDELNVAITQKWVTPIVLYLRHAHYLCL
jgi:hypothetical protein